MCIAHRINKRTTSSADSVKYSFSHKSNHLSRLIHQVKKSNGKGLKGRTIPTMCIAHRVNKRNTSSAESAKYSLRTNSNLL